MESMSKAYSDTHYDPFAEFPVLSELINEHKKYERFKRTVAETAKRFSELKNILKPEEIPDFEIAAEQVMHRMNTELADMKTHLEADIENTSNLRGRILGRKMNILEESQNPCAEIPLDSSPSSPSTF